MLANIKPGKPARLVGAITTPSIIALIDAKRRNEAVLRSLSEQRTQSIV
jgi:hypothetical protein